MTGVDALDQIEHIVIEGPKASGKTTIAQGIIHSLGRNWIVDHIRDKHEYRPNQADIFIWDGIEPPPNIKVTRRIKVEVIS